MVINNTDMCVTIHETNKLLLNFIVLNMKNIVKTSYLNSRSALLKKSVDSYIGRASSDEYRRDIQIAGTFDSISR